MASIDQSFFQLSLAATGRLAVTSVLLFFSLTTMTRQLYDSNRENWSALFGAVRDGGRNQGGTGKIAYFTGGRPQFGGGIGGILRRILSAIPSFLSSPIGKSLVSAGANVASDIREGASVGDALKTHARSTVRNLTGVGRRRAMLRSVQQQQQQLGGSARVIGFLRSNTGGKRTTTRRRAAADGVSGRSVSAPIRRAFIR